MKKWFVLSIILAVLIGIGIAYSSCFNCPTDGLMGYQIAKQRTQLGWIYTYKCGNGHVWQCAP